VARYPQPPGTLLNLGSILTDPENPETCLNWQTGLEPVPQGLILDGSMAVRQQIHSELSTNNSLLLKAVFPASPLYSAGAKVEGKSSDEIKTVVQAMDVSAKYFIPNKAYTDKVFVKDEIITHVRKHHFSTPLFMVVGVATAGKLKVEEDQSRERSFAAGANAAAAGAEAELELAHGSSAKAGGSLEVDERCDFAYRTRQFLYNKIRRKVTDHGDVTTGAMFGRSEESDKREGEEQQEEEFPEFEGWGDEDIEVPEGFTITTPEPATTT
jgi:hypothetical protein